MKNTYSKTKISEDLLKALDGKGGSKEIIDIKQKLINVWLKVGNTKKGDIAKKKEVEEVISKAYTIVYN